MFASFNPGHIGLQVSLEEGMVMARRHGFAGFDFPMPQASAYAEQHGAEALKQLAARHDLKLGTWNLPFSPYGEEDVWKRGLEDLKPMAELAEEVGALRTAMWILPGSDTLTFEENFDLHVARFRPIVELLRPHGIRLGLEFVGPKTARQGRKHEFVHDLAGIRKLCAAVGPGTGLLLDSWHWFTSGAGVDDLAGLSNEDIVHVHVNDAPAGVPLDEQRDGQRKLPGTTGVIDIKGFLGALVAAGYDGPVTAEPMDKQLDEMAPEERVALNAETVLGVLKGYA